MHFDLKKILIQDSESIKLKCKTECLQRSKFIIDSYKLKTFIIAKLIEIIVSHSAKFMTM